MSFFIVSGALLLWSGNASAGEEPVTVPSTLKSAMVYRVGAELTHFATARLEKGNNQLVITDVSNAIDESSIRIRCSSGVTILSVAVSTNYLVEEVASPIVRRLQDSISGIEKELARLAVLTRTDNEMLELLGSNKSIGGTTTGVSVAELAKMMDYYRQKSIELRTELVGYAEKDKHGKEIREKLKSQIQEEEKKNARTGGALVLQLMSPNAGPCDFNISYLTTAAHWQPFYDLKAGGSTDSLHLLYKAHLMQTSGIDWRRVKLSLSTAVPTQSGNAPVLQAWFLRFVQDVVVIGYGTMNSASNRIAAPAAAERRKDLDGAFAFKAEEKNDLGDYLTVNEQQMDAVFDIDIPYDVAGNGKEQSVELKEYRLPCNYQYYAAPRVDREAYLLGQVTGWERLNLLPGEASIMVDGTYIGKSSIDPGSLQDTLNLTLGKDKRIVIKKEKMTDYSSVKFLGSNKKQVYTYEITVRNNKKDKASLILKDQYPISTDKEIETELLDAGGATVNTDTGILTWKVDLAPGDSRKYRVSYGVKYPKDKSVNMN
jgi:uncharacterized protein (TIGR02231 family)